MKNAVRKSILIIIPILIVGGIGLKLTKFESGKPWVRLTGRRAAFGPRARFPGRGREERPGHAPRRSRAGREDLRALVRIASRRRRAKPSIKISLRPLPAGFADGEVLIRITAEDRSWNGGNVTVFEKKMIIDTKPPRLTVLGGPHYINQGGAGCVAFTSDEPPASSGIRVGDVEFAGFPVGIGPPRDLLRPGLRPCPRTSPFRPSRPTPSATGRAWPSGRT